MNPLVATVGGSHTSFMNHRAVSIEIVSRAIIIIRRANPLKIQMAMPEGEQLLTVSCQKKGASSCSRNLIDPSPA